MKNKDLKKLTEKLEEIIPISIQNSLEQNQKYYVKVDREIGEDYKIADYNDEVSDKFKKLVLNLLDYNENLNIDINSNRIFISTNDIKSVKKKHYSNNSQLVSSDEHYLEISIVKEHSFSINRGYSKRTNYKDNSMYDYFFPVVTKKLQEINSDNFNEIWNEIMKESGMMRDNNLDNLFPQND